MQKNSTDYIAKLSWETVTTHWKIFVLLPLAPLGLALPLGALAALNKSASLEDLIVWIQLFYLIVLFFYVVYSGAAAQWCDILFKGGKKLDLKSGLRYGLNRAGGTIGTGLLTGLKIFLWTLLFILPGIYKTLVYSQSVQISQLEKISGGDANRLSKKLIGEAGILRTVGNLFVLVLLLEIVGLGVYAVTAGSILFTAVQTHQNVVMTTIVGGVGALLFFTSIAGIVGFATCFKNFQYLCFREENKVAFQKAIKELKSING